MLSMLFQYNITLLGCDAAPDASIGVEAERREP
jgi:hypothetical protein